jgi:uncharacterized repeat protein (TIGR01451 family)
MQEMSKEIAQPVRWLGLLAMLLALGWQVVGPPPSLATPLYDDDCEELLYVSAGSKVGDADKPVVERLKDRGYEIEVRAAAQVQASDAAGKALVIISQSVNSPDIEDRLRDIATPILTWEAFLYDNLRMAGPEPEVDYGRIVFTSKIRMSGVNHPLAAGLTGDVTFSSNPLSNFQWGIPNQNAVIIAVTPDQTGRGYLFAYEKGAQMFGMAAPARRVGFPYATGEDMTAEAWALFDAAVDWAAACADSESPTATATASPSATATVTPSETTTVPPSPTETATPTATTTPTPTATDLLPDSPTPSETPIPSATPTSTATDTPPLATATPTLTPTVPVAASPTPTATPGARAQLVVQKVDFLFQDVDQDERVSSGDRLLYQLQVSNQGEGGAQTIRLEDQPTAGLQLVAGTVRTTRGVISSGNEPTDRAVVVELETLPSGSSFSVGFHVVITAQPGSQQVENQALVSYVHQERVQDGSVLVLSDDPDAPASSDPTVTVLEEPGAAPSHRLILPLILQP